MAGIFDKRIGVARTIASSASDDETDEDLVGLDRKQLERLAERLGVHAARNRGGSRAAIRSIIEPAAELAKVH